jgi:hypothetical protein
MTNFEQTEELLDEVIRMEIKNLYAEACKGRLSPASAKDAVAYKKLFHEMKDRDAEIAAELSKLSDNELKDVLDASKVHSRTASEGSK